MNNLRQLLCLGVLLFTTVSRLHAGAPCQPPKGLSQSEWSGLRAAYNAARHRIVGGEGGPQARNPGQHWRTRFDGQGFLVQPDGADWQWGLELIAYGFSGREHTLPTGRATTLAEVVGARLDYAWDAGLSEWFVNDARGLEHGFTVHERPEDRQVLDCGDMSPLSLHHDWLTDAGQLHDSKEKRRPAGAVQAVDATATQPAIHSPRSTLNFRLAVRGGLRPVLEPGGRGVRFVDAHGTTRTTYSGLKVWDADGHALPAHFKPLDAERPGEITLAVNERGARYPLTIDPIAQQAFLKASNAEAEDFFGGSVTVSGDTVVVGTSFEDSKTTGVDGDQTDNSAQGSGAAYVFIRHNGQWTQQAYLKASNAEMGDLFGARVALSNDTLIVGAPQEDSNATDVNGNQADNSALGAGAAYVFVRNGAIWTQQAYLKAGSAWDLTHFGASVAVSGDTLIVGAPGDSSNGTGVNNKGTGNNATDSGAAYVFVRNGKTWTQQAYLKASNTGGMRYGRFEGDAFGACVAISGDTVVVGAPREASEATGVNGDQADNNAPDSGAAYVFTRSGTIWTQEAYLKASNTGPGDWFGRSVAVSGDTVVVGASEESSDATGVDGDQTNNHFGNSGAAYVFHRHSNTWTQQAYLKASNTKPSGLFGTSVAVAGKTIIVGAPGDAGNVTGVIGKGEVYLFNSGGAYVFTNRGTIWSQKAYLRASNADSGDGFGDAVAMSDGTMVVGARWEDSNATGVNGSFSDRSAFGSGAAYAFALQEPEIRIEQPAGVARTDRASSFHFGAVSVSGSTDLVFTVRNSGTTNLTDFGVNLNGPDANQFLVTANPGPSLAPGERTTFTVRFSPTSEDTKTATLHLASNDPDHNPFDLTLVGTPNVPTVATSGNDLTVSFVGTPGSRYRVQYLPGLTGPWTELTPPALYVAPASGVFSHTDLNPPDALRLYRAVLAP